MHLKTRRKVRFSLSCLPLTLEKENLSLRESKEEKTVKKSALAPILPQARHPSVHPPQTAGFLRATGHGGESLSIWSGSSASEDFYQLWLGALISVSIISARSDKALKLDAVVDIYWLSNRSIYSQYLVDNDASGFCPVCG